MLGYNGKGKDITITLSQQPFLSLPLLGGWGGGGYRFVSTQPLFGTTTTDFDQTLLHA